MKHLAFHSSYYFQIFNCSSYLNYSSNYTKLW